MESTSNKDGTPPFKIDPGDWLKHTGSRALYQYHGKNQVGLHVISTKDGQSAYTIEEQTLQHWYEKTGNPHNTVLEPNQKYHNDSINTQLIYHVREVFPHPVDGRKTAFAWVYYPSGNIFPTTIPENKFNNFTKLD